MICSHNVVFLLDTASPARARPLRLGPLRVLNYLGCKFGLTRIRWGFKFFDSSGAHGRPCKVSSFRELGSRSWGDFEEELEARLGPPQPGQRSPVAGAAAASRAALMQNVLKESLLDYQWDRPEIASPAKPVLRSRKGKASAGSSSPPSCEGFGNAVFLFSPCPHSQRELLQFISGAPHARPPAELPLLAPQELAEKLIPKSIQKMMERQKITLYWVDTTEGTKFLESPDHVGYWLLFDLMCLLGGRIFPFQTVIQYLNHYKKEPSSTGSVESSSAEFPFTPWTAILPFDSTLNYLFSSPSALQKSFPHLEGILLLNTDGTDEVQSCPVILEPLTVNQRCIKGPVSISLKCTMTGWNAVHARSFYTESWVLRNTPSESSVRGSSLFEQLVQFVLVRGLEVVAEISLPGACPPSTGIFSPISDSAAILSLLCAERAPENEKSDLLTIGKGDFSLLEIAKNVLHQVEDVSEKGTVFPEWAQQELSHTDPWNPSVIENWYSLSNECGASSHLMELFRNLSQTRLPQAGTAAEVPEPAETPQTEKELMHCLSEFYQKKISDTTTTCRQRDHRKRRGVPRTPVRQKMKTMPRSLQMLNVARMNVKAQRVQSGGEPSGSERVSQRLLARRLDDKVEERGKLLKVKMGFQSEEEMFSYVSSNCQKAVKDGENLYSCAQDTIAAVNTLHKSNEVSCLDTVRSTLLKTSQSLRQQIGSEPNKEIRIRECQLQVYLRLEMCLQCPPLQNSADGMEQLVEEMTEMLRILCLTEDPGCLTRFLEGIVEIYVESIPKILGDLYYSLGTQIPPRLAHFLPSDFFSDDSLSQENQPASLPASATSVPVSRAASLSTDADQLEELRTRSAQKRKKSLTRHRSVTEASQNLRQIEIPQVPKNCPRKDNSQDCLDVKSAPTIQKGTGQEIIKVRRNLFNEKILSPRKTSLRKIPRSQSVSALEGLKSKHNRPSESVRENHKLLTKQVAETPLHKQISRRLLQKQINGRSSDPGSEAGIVEESPEKSLTCGLRRSPRIKQLLHDKTLSGSFRSLQPSKTNSQQIQSGVADDKEDLTDLASRCVKKTVQSPKSLLFGAVLSELDPREMDTSRTGKRALSSDKLVRQTPRKTPLQPWQQLSSPPNSSLRRSPRFQGKLYGNGVETPALKTTAAKSLGSIFSLCKQKSKSLPEPIKKEDDYLTQAALTEKMSASPYKAIQLQTPEKQASKEAVNDVFASPPSSSNSAAALLVTTPALPSMGKVQSELQFARRSLRVSKKTASPALAQTPLREADPQPPLPQATGQSEVTPTAFRDTFSELFPSPKSSELMEACSPQLCSIALLDLDPLPSSPNVSTETARAGSPSRTGKLSRKASMPRKSPLKRQSSPTSSPRKILQSPICLAVEQLNGSSDQMEHQESGKLSLLAKTDPFCVPGIMGCTTVEQNHEAGAPSKEKGRERDGSPESSSENHPCVPEAGVGCERLDAPSQINKSVSPTSGGKQGLNSSRAGVLPPRKAQRLSSSSSSRCDASSLPTSSQPASCTYSLRRTPDRRQREAAARLGKAEQGVTFSAPPARTPPSALSPPTYEVELEMQASGLPKLRFKRVPSESALKLQSPPEPGKPKGGEGDLTGADLSVAWCGRHSGKLESASISPTCMSSAHSTPGKFGGGQTYICQSYTPTHCTSRSTSPSQGSVSIPWTPSPKQKGKVTPDSIKDWPRKKRATGGSRNEKQADASVETSAPDAGKIEISELFTGKSLLLSEFEVEGVYKLQDESPCSDAEPAGDEGSCRETSDLKSRKRPFARVSPDLESRQEIKRCCQKREKPGVCSGELLSPGKKSVFSSRTVMEKEDVFSSTGSTPPSVKTSISSTGLQALTQSPLLYQGHSKSLTKCSTGDDADALRAADEDFSLFYSIISKQRSARRTYSRKRLLT